MRLTNRSDTADIVQEPSDAELLRRFVESKDEVAFEAMVRRHGTMVYQVCQRTLSQVQDAEDAFQATFVVLVQRAASVAKMQSIGGWLHGVAYRISLRARARSAQRHETERPLLETPPARETPTEVLQRELRPVLDEEINRLPEKYRVPLVMCYLEGKTNDEAAAELGWTRGKVAGKLAAARDLLRDRLARRGLAVTCAVLTAIILQEKARASVPSLLVGATVKKAFLGAGVLQSGPVGTLAVATLKSAAWAKIRITVVAGAVGGAILVSALMATFSSSSLRATLDSSPQSSRAVAFSPDGKLLACGGSESRVDLYDVATCEKKASYPATQRVHQLVFSQDGRYLAASGGHSLATVISIETGEAWPFLMPNGQSCRYLGFDSKALVAIPVEYRPTNRPIWDCPVQIRRYDLDSGKTGGLFKTSMTTSMVGPVQLAAFSRDGQFVAVGDDDQLRLWSTRTGKPRPELNVREIRTTSLAFAHDGRSLAAASDIIGDTGNAVSGVHVFALSDGAETLRLAVEGPIHCLAYSADGKMLAGGKPNGCVSVWDVESRSLLQEINAHNSSVNALDFSPDGTILATCAADSVKVWNVTKPR